MTTQYNDDNVFWRIINSTAPAKRLFEDELCLAFEDVRPQYDVHILFVPKGRYVDYSDFCARATNSEVVHFFKALERVAKQYAIAGHYSLATNCGTDAGQVVFHFHVHITSGNRRM